MYPGLSSWEQSRVQNLDVPTWNATTASAAFKEVMITFKYEEKCFQGIYDRTSGLDEQEEFVSGDLLSVAVGELGWDVVLCHGLSEAVAMSCSVLASGHPLELRMGLAVQWQVAPSPGVIPLALPTSPR